MPVTVLAFAAAAECSAPYVVELLRFDHTGEEVAVLRDANWMTPPVALRYAAQELRHRHGPGSQAAQLRAVRLLYAWAEAPDRGALGHFERFLTSGQRLTVEQLKSLKDFLALDDPLAPADQTTPADEADEEGAAFDWLGEDASVARDLARVAGPTALASPKTLNSRLSAVRDFLEWAVEPSNHGGSAVLTVDEREHFVGYMTRKFAKWRKPEAKSVRAEPLRPLEVRLVRAAVAPDRFGRFRRHVIDGRTTGFKPETRHRNWAMFEVAFNYGPRISELLSIRLRDHVPDPDREPTRRTLYIPRQQNEPGEARRRVRGKTVARLVPPLDPRAFSNIKPYWTAAPPAGRPPAATPYLFTTDDGCRALSRRAAELVIRRVGHLAAHVALADPEVLALGAAERTRVVESLRALRWHRLRHTWAELAATLLYRQYGDGFVNVLKEWGGWRSTESMHHYTQHARRQLGEQAAEDYLRSFDHQTSGGR